MTLPAGTRVVVTKRDVDRVIGHGEVVASVGDTYQREGSGYGDATEDLVRVKMDGALVGYAYPASMVDEEE